MNDQIRHQTITISREAKLSFQRLIRAGCLLFVGILGSCDDCFATSGAATAHLFQMCSEQGKMPKAIIVLDDEDCWRIVGEPCCGAIEDEIDPYPFYPHGKQGAQG